LQVGGQGQGDTAVFRLADHFDMVGRFQQQAQTAANDGMVINNEHLDFISHGIIV
jgi:hypothetical protein